MSWGAIYCQTWFGSPKNIEESLGEEVPECTWNQFYQDYYDRVIADGATFEGGKCLAIELQNLKEI